MTMTGLWNFKPFARSYSRTVVVEGMTRGHKFAESMVGRWGLVSFLAIPTSSFSVPYVSSNRIWMGAASIGAGSEGRALPRGTSEWVARGRLLRHWERISTLENSNLGK